MTKLSNDKTKHVEEPQAEESVTRGRGRPLQFAMPERIDASPERIAEVVLGAKPKDTWRYEEETGRQRTRKEKA
ncbi:MAG: hypothetical protein F4Z14_00580 [Gammaproteobacteria bacterium]|nr:hypothetical protein [Gammaproteobacteria bacterium]